MFRTTVGAKPKDPAKALRKDGVDVYAIGIRGARESELLDMTDDPNKVFQIKDFALLSESIAAEISKNICTTSAG